MDVPALLSALADHGFGDETTTRKVAVLQDAIWDIESRSPWPFLETSIDLNFNGSSDSPTNFPTNFRAALRVMDISRPGVRIRPVRLDDSEDYMMGNYALVGDPLIYYFLGGTMKFWPIPPAGTGTIRLRYVQTSAAITSSSPETDILIPKRHHNAILYGALWQLYEMEDDSDIAARYQQHYEARLQSMEEDVWRRQFDQGDYVHVIDPDDYDFDLL